MPEPEELTRFPLKMLPRLGNMNFYGRRDELARIDRYLKWEGNASLRTFCIYGHRGLGKTEIALEFAHKNPSRFDAIFWIGCESILSLRQSFSNIAMSKYYLSSISVEMGNLIDES
jgi:AAA+ ATPase superfamily predicted ATPase